MGGLISFLLSFTRVIRNGVNVSDSKVDPGAGANITCEHFSSPGDDSFPLEGDYVLLVKIKRTGKYSVSGYLDPLNAQTAQVGEKRMYSRDSAGAEIARVFLKNTGEVEIVNANGSITLKADGEIELNSGAAQFKVFPTGQIIGSNAGGLYSLSAAGLYDVSNSFGHMRLLANGNVDLNGVIITPAGQITVPSGESVIASSMVVNGKELDAHVHGGIEPGGGTTGPNQ